MHLRRELSWGLSQLCENSMSRGSSNENCDDWVLGAPFVYYEYTKFFMEEHLTLFFSFSNLVLDLGYVIYIYIYIYCFTFDHKLKCLINKSNLLIT